MEDNKSNLIKALIKAKREFKEIIKDKTGRDGHRTYKYADLDSVLKAINPALLDNGLFFSHSMQVHEDQCDLVLTVYHESGESMVSDYPIDDPRKGKIKEYGSLQTYLRRYSVEAMFGIVGEQDDDGNLGQRYREDKPPTKAKPSKSNPPARQETKPLTEPITEKDLKKGGPRVSVKLDPEDPELKLKQGKLKTLGFIPNVATKTWEKPYNEQEAALYNFEFSIIE